MPSKNHLYAIALLKADHRNVEELFAEFEAATGAAKKQALVERWGTRWSPASLISFFLY